MIFICNAANEITPIFSGNLRQGSISANEILLLAPYSKSGTTVTLRVLLPNGILLPSDPSKAFVFAPIEFADDMPLMLDTTALNAWRLRVDASITEFAGNISFQFAISRIGGNGIPPALFTTTTVVENIPRGVPSIPGDGVDYDPSILDLYTAAAAALEAAAAALTEIETLAEEVQNNSDYVRENVGDLQSAFKELHTYAQTIINGGTL